MIFQKRSCLRLFLIGAILGAFLTAQIPAAQAAEKSVGACTDVESVLDEVVLSQLEEHQVPGLTLSVVADGAVVLAKGYGLANVAEARRVDPAKTLFNLGSVAKPVTWTAVMQLVEQGRLDLNADVRTYLPAALEIPNAFNAPITLAHLMAHSAGFEDRIIGISSRDPVGPGALQHYLLDRGLPDQVEPPGTFSVYCNHCLALAAYIVERVTGMPFADYVETHIFQPLGMTNSTLHQRRFRDFFTEKAVGYHLEDGAWIPGAIEYPRVMGAGGLYSTAADMERFMIAHLDGGTLDGQRILRAETVAQMQSGLFRMDERLPGVSYGWWEGSRNGRAILDHGGDSTAFSSFLGLLPEERAGLFLSYNRQTSGPRNAIWHAFLDACFPAPDEMAGQVLAVGADPAAADRQQLSRFAGTYRGNRISYSSVAKVAAIMNVKRVTVTENGHLSLDGVPYVEVAPLLFQQVNGEARIAFRTDELGRVTHLLAGRGSMAYERMRWFDQLSLHGGLLAASLLIFLASLCGWIVVTMRSRPRLTVVTVARGCGIVLSLLALGAVGSFAYFFTMTSVALVMFGMPVLLTAAVVLSTAAAVVAAAVVVLAALLWVRREGNVWGRLHYTAVALMGVAFVWVLTYWNFVQIPVVWSMPG